MTNKLYKLMNWAKIEEITYSECDNPHELLGPHKQGSKMLVQAFFPGAEKVTIHWKKTGQVGEAFLADVPMELADEEGYFAALINAGKMAPYEYVVEYGKTEEREAHRMICGDAYRHVPQITKEDMDRFAVGVHYTIYEKLGAHPMELDGESGTYFAVWAPNAMRISVVGDFNGWDGRIHQMRRLGDSGIFELFIPGAEAGNCYKYELKIKGGLTYLKADPYGNAAQKRPETASVIADLRDFSWDDSEFLKKRESYQCGNAPVSVYEMYLGSFVTPDEGQDYANYREIAPKVIDYVKKMGYTHVELMPVMEHPLDASWGYQVIGYYAPTARYGTPEDFMFFVNELHKAGIGVILDWVPAHFPRDTYGLSGFDGTCLYEHQDPRQGSHPHWGTLIYNYGRPQVSNYLIANALFWVEKYHADGIRMDAVASMLYLDYGKQDGEWVANMYGGNENLEAIAFLRDLSDVMHERNKGALLIAEESTAWPKVTEPSTVDGLGFDLKWNMGWMNDFTTYMQTDPLFRKGRHGMLTFSMIYAYSEKFVLVFSHDEVVHLKGSMFAKMPGEPEEKYANLRVAYGFMMAHPGKKLLFMGQEFAQENEWNEKQELPWKQAEEPDHRALQQYVKALNTFYQEHPAWYETDFDAEGFEWLSSMDADHSIITFMRYDAKKEERLLVVCNFTPVTYENFKIGVPVAGKYKEIFNTDAAHFGGQNILNEQQLSSEKVERNGCENSIVLDLPPLALTVYAYEPFTKLELEEIRIREEAELAAKAAQEQAWQAEQLKVKAEEEAQAALEAQKQAELAAKAAQQACEEAEKQAQEAEAAKLKIEQETKKKLAALKRRK